MKLHDLKSPEGSTHRKKIVGRGIAGKGGKTAGRGTKGQKARRQIPAGFEGGQLPLLQRIPKLKGFTNPFRVEYTPVNLDALVTLGVTEINPDVLVARGLARKKDLVKILGRGELSTRAARLGAPFLGVGEGRHRSGGRLRDRTRPAFQRASAGGGQPAPEPVEFVRAAASLEHLPGTGPSQQGPVHHCHHLPLPVGRQFAHPRSELVPGDPSAIQGGGQRGTRFLEPLLGRRPDETGRVRPRGHALHHEFHRDPTAHHRDPQARRMARPGPRGPKAHHPDDAVPDHWSGPAAVDRAGLRLPRTRPGATGLQHRPDPQVQPVDGPVHGDHHDRGHWLRHVARGAHHPARHRPGHESLDLRERRGGSSLGR